MVTTELGRCVPVCVCVRAHSCFIYILYIAESSLISIWIRCWAMLLLLLYIVEMESGDV